MTFLCQEHRHYQSSVALRSTSLSRDGRLVVSCECSYLVYLFAATLNASQNRLSETLKIGGASYVDTLDTCRSIAWCHFSGGAPALYCMYLGRVSVSFHFYVLGLLISCPDTASPSNLLGFTYLWTPSMTRKSSTSLSIGHQVLFGIAMYQHTLLGFMMR